MVNAKSERRYSPILILTLVVLAALCVVNLFVSLDTSRRLNRAEPASTERAETDSVPPRVTSPQITPRVAFVTGGVDPFWDITVAGARDAATRYGADLEVLVPEQGADGQDIILRELLAKKVDGVAVSPLDATGQTELLNQVASEMGLVTFDSDAPQSHRLCYIGTNNYTAGRLCGEVVGRALPEGGRVLISVGSLTKDNGSKRRQGLIDQLLDREFDPARAADPADAELAGKEFTILATILDDNDAGQARANMAQALVDHSDVDCVVGLFGYSGPSILEALAEIGNPQQVKVVAFDDHDATLKAVRDGRIEATIVQDAYQFGYASIEALATLSRNEGMLPMSKEILFPCFAVTKDNMDRFVADRQARLDRKNR